MTPDELGRALAELDAKATEGPWEAVDMDEADQDKRHAMEIVTVGWFAGVCLGHRTPGYPGGNYRDTDYGTPLNDASLCAAVRSHLPLILSALATKAAEDEIVLSLRKFDYANVSNRAAELLAEWTKGTR